MQALYDEKLNEVIEEKERIKDSYYEKECYLEEVKESLTKDL